MEVPEWRRRILRRLDIALIVFQAVLSAVFLIVGLSTENLYFRGVGIGLVIAWVTTSVAVAYRSLARPVA